MGHRCSGERYSCWRSKNFRLRSWTATIVIHNIYIQGIKRPRLSVSFDYIYSTFPLLYFLLVHIPRWGLKPLGRYYVYIILLCLLLGSRCSCTRLSFVPLNCLSSLIFFLFFFISCAELCAHDSISLSCNKSSLVYIYMTSRIFVRHFIRAGQYTLSSEFICHLNYWKVQLKIRNIERKVYMYVLWPNGVALRGERERERPSR